MVMEQVQVRMSKGILKRIDGLVKQGDFSTRSEVIRDAVKGFVWEKEVGTIPNTGDSVKEIRKIRKILSKQIKSWKDVEKINKLYD